MYDVGARDKAAELDGVFARAGASPLRTMPGPETTPGRGPDFVAVREVVVGCVLDGVLARGGAARVEDVLSSSKYR